VEAALYDDRTLVRMLGMRRTLFTVPTELAPVVHASSTLAVAANERRRLEQLLETAGVVARVRPWLRKVEAATLAAVAERGEVAGAELTTAVPGLDTKLHLSEGKAYAATVSLSSRLLLVLAAEGHLVRGRPRGGWTSGQHRWSATEHWLGGPLEELDPAEAKVDLARRWLGRFGPATVADLAWWTGWTLGATRAALAALDTEEVQLDDGTIGLVLRDDVDEVAPPDPWVALLPGLDPTPMGWKERAWYLGPHRAQVIDRNGNIGPTVWADGRIVGGWAQRKDGEIVTHLLDDLGREQAEAVTAAAARLERAIGDVRFTPRFPAPLDKALVAGGAG
jgi:hypothetical protein